jgi:hypothetical protein
MLGMKQKICFLLVTCVILSSISLSACKTPEYTLSVSSIPQGGGSVSPASGIYKRGEEVTLIAAPAQYYKFDGWGGDESGTSTHLTIKMDSNKRIVASFVKTNYSLSIQINPSGGGSVEPQSGTYDGGTQLTMKATAANGYRFNQWGGSASGSSNTVNIMMDSNKAVTASFTKVFTLSTSCNPTSGGSISLESGIYDSGSTLSVSATAVFPYVFTNWGGADNNSINPTSVTMNSDKSVIAYFRQQQAGLQQTVTGVYKGYEVHIPMTVGTGQWVQGGITSSNYAINVRILDPVFNVVVDLGAISNGGFTFQAQASGIYYLYILYGMHYYNSDYVMKYTIYS